MSDLKEQIAKWNAKRDALFRNPTLKGARAMMPEPPGGYARPDVPLAALHKARLQWIDVTDEMIAESEQWLATHGYKDTMRGAPSFTPETRDAERVQRGMKPLRLQ